MKRLKRNRNNPFAQIIGIFDKRYGRSITTVRVEQGPQQPAGGGVNPPSIDPDIVTTIGISDSGDVPVSGDVILAQGENVDIEKSGNTITFRAAGVAFITDLLTPPVDGQIYYNTATDILYYGSNGQYIPLVPGSSLLLLFFTDDASSDIAGYSQLLSTVPSGAKSNIATLVTANDQEIEQWATESGVPAITLIDDGIVHKHIHAKVDATAGTKRIRLYFKTYLRHLDNSETLISTSETSNELTTSEVEYNIETAIAEMVVLDTDRIVVKLFANLTGAGGNPTLTIYMEGDTLSRVEIPVMGGTGGGVDDHKVLTSATDTIANYLQEKLSAGTNITLTLVTDLGTGEETLLIAAAGGTGLTHPQVIGRIMVLG